MRYSFETVDVFTDRRFGGNPLAVFPEAAGLSDAQMQAIANEFNLSETTFVLPPKDPAHSAQVRIFTPKFEMPFAGHPNVGTAFVVARRGHPHDPLRFEEKAGLVPVDLLREGGEVAGARLTAPRSLTRGDDVDPAAVAEACGLDPADIVTRHHRPCVAGCGTIFNFAEVATRAALERAAPRGDVFARHFPVEGATGIHLYLRDGADGIDIRTRMFAPLHGVPEDPATGSANLALVGLLASLRPEPDLTLNLRMAQGVEMGRPSFLDGSVEKRGGRLGLPRIGGRCVAMMTGAIDI
ncbi:MAG TPA: PhzF family phenazine biosynthesis protein [Stellaceae bacterium]|nr:PhzF family phenazine biosynthesis protein [Stellaceae bacterium]